jgi:hypothetical protein
MLTWFVVSNLDDNGSMSLDWVYDDHPPGRGECIAISLSHSHSTTLDWTLRLTCDLSIFQVIIADLTSLRSRLFFSFVPALPFIVSPLVARSNRAWGTD